MKRILVVEDEWIIAMNLKEMLESLGYEVISLVHTGEEAVRVSEAEHPNIVLMDILLRGKMDGIEAADYLYSILDVPVVYLTSFTDEKTLERAKESEPFGYILKPFEKRELHIVIEMALYKHEMDKRLKEKTKQLEELNRNLETRVKEEIEKGRKKDRMIIQQSKLMAMGEMMVAIAHQWRQPLNVIGLLVQDLEDAYNFGEVDKQYIKDMTTESMAQLAFMSKTISDFTNFFKPVNEKVLFDVKVAIEEVITLVHTRLDSSQIILDCEFKRPAGDYSDGDYPTSVLQDAPHAQIMVKGYPDAFKQVILIIINNARDSILRKRQYELFSSNRKGLIRIIIEDQAGNVVIRVKDNGVGIAEDICERIFEPYFTTKESGIGIGLYMSKIIIENHMSGKLYTENADDGAIFCIELVI